MSNTFFDSIKTEYRFAIRRKVLIVLLIIIILNIVYTYHTVYHYAIHINATLDDTRKFLGTSFLEHIAIDPGLASFRESFWSIHPLNGPNLTLSLFYILGCLLMAFWGAMIIAGDFDWRTAKVKAVHNGWASTIMARFVLIIAGAIGLALTLMAFGVIGNHIVWALFAHRAADIASVLPTPPLYPPVWREVLVLALGTTFYGVLAGLIALSIRSATAGAVVTALLPFLEPAARFWWLPRALYGTLVAKNFAFYAAIGAAAAPEQKPPPGGSLALAWLILVVWCLCSLVIAWIAAKRQPIS